MLASSAARRVFPTPGSPPISTARRSPSACVLPRAHAGPRALVPDRQRARRRHLEARPGPGATRRRDLRAPQSPELRTRADPEPRRPRSAPPGRDPTETCEPRSINVACSGRSSRTSSPRRLRQQDLTAGSQTPNTSRPVNRRTVVIAVAFERLAGVQRHPHRQRRGLRPRLAHHCLLGGTARRVEGVRRRGRTTEKMLSPSPRAFSTVPRYTVTAAVISSSWRATVSPSSLEPAPTSRSSRRCR